MTEIEEFRTASEEAGEELDMTPRQSRSMVAGSPTELGHEQSGNPAKTHESAA